MQLWYSDRNSYYQTPGWDLLYNPIKDYDWTLPITDPSNQAALNAGLMSIGLYSYFYGNQIVIPGIINSFLRRQ